jgi:hypothetical protein
MNPAPKTNFLVKHGKSTITSRMTIEIALRDVNVPNKKLQAFTFINTYLSPNAFRTRGEFPSKEIFQ